MRNELRNANLPGMVKRKASGRDGGVNSVEIGLRVARILAERPGARALKDLAAAARLAPAKAHRYLVSLGRAGLVEQERETGRYRLGPLALDFGLGAMRELDVLRLGAEAVADLRAAIDETVLLAIWGNRGPVVVRWEESSRPITTNVRAGFVMPLLNSSTGRVFAAYLPDALTAPILAEEFARRPEDRAGWPALLAEVRQRGLARVEGSLSPGVAALSAPVWDAAGRCTAVLSALGHQGVFDTAWDGRHAQAVRDISAKYSNRLGYRT